MAGVAGTHHIVVSRGFFAAGVTHHGIRYTLNVLINALHSPEATSRQNDSRLRRGGRNRFRWWVGKVCRCQAKRQKRNRQTSEKNVRFHQDLSFYLTKKRSRRLTCP